MKTISKEALHCFENELDEIISSTYNSHTKYMLLTNLYDYYKNIFGLESVFSFHPNLTEDWDEKVKDFECQFLTQIRG